MFRFISLLLIGIGGYFAFQNRYRIMNMVFGNRMIRRAFVSFLMSFPFVKNRMMKSLFSEPAM